MALPTLSGVSQYSVVISADLLIVSDFNGTFMKLGFPFPKINDADSHPGQAWMKSRCSLINHWPHFLNTPTLLISF